MFGIFYGLFAAFRGLGSIAADNNSKYRGRKYHYLENIKCYSDDRGRLWDYETNRQVALGTSRINGHKCVVDVKTGEEIRDLEWEWGQKETDERFAHGAFAVIDPYLGTREVVPVADGLGKHCQYVGRNGDEYFITKFEGRRYYVDVGTRRIVRSTDYQRSDDIYHMERMISGIHKFDVEIKEKSLREQDIENSKKWNKYYYEYKTGKYPFPPERSLDISEHQYEKIIKLNEYDKIAEWDKYNDEWEKLRDEAWASLPWHDYEAAMLAFMDKEWRAANPDAEPPMRVKDMIERGQIR